MYLTEMEILAQPEALKQTYEYFEKHSQRICDFFKNSGTKKFVFMGCGSSFMLCKGLQHIFTTQADTWAVSLAGGEYLVNPQLYAQAVEDANIVLISRSGMTTELIRSVQYMREHHHVQIIAVTMNSDSTLAQMADLSIDLVWAYDKSVCQTRSVSTLYIGTLLLFSICFDNQKVKDSILKMVNEEQELLEQIHPIAKEVAKRNFDNVIVLADGNICGIAEEGSLAFTEIAMVSGKYFHVLDYRHGPKVLNDENTLTIVVVPKESETYHKDMIDDLKTHNGTIVVVDNMQENIYDATFHVCVKDAEESLEYGIGLINTCQLIAFEKALLNGNNPDQPKGLDAFISLK